MTLRQMSPVDFARAPFLVIWEVTRACALACRHCRAEAKDQRDPGELTVEEGRQLLEDVARMETPIIIFSGGDPLQRDDLEPLVSYGKSLGLRVGVIPAATPRLTRERVISLVRAGVDQLALSLDGSTAERHDGFRMVDGSFAKTMAAAAWAREAGVPLQINTTLAAWNCEDFDAIADLVCTLDLVFWEVFFLVPTGRGAELQGCSAEQCERLFGKLFALAQRVPFLIKIAEAPHYRRYVLQHAAEYPHILAPARQTHSRVGEGPARRMGLSPMPVNAGKGFCFVDHVGNVFPSGFLPASAGNVRQTSVIQLYRSSPLFTTLRRPALLKGRCGRCEFKESCGGSRSRAYALTGDYLQEDASCVHEPAPTSLQA